MLHMNQIDQVKELQRQGHGSLEIAGRLKIDRKTVAKYMREEHFNEKAREKRAPASKLDPWKPIIDGWLEEAHMSEFPQQQRRLYPGVWGRNRGVRLSGTDGYFSSYRRCAEKDYV